MGESLVDLRGEYETFLRGEVGRSDGRVAANNGSIDDEASLLTQLPSSPLLLFSFLGDTVTALQLDGPHCDGH